MKWLAAGELDVHHTLELVRSLFTVPGSRFAAAFRGDGSLGWDRNSPILADIADTLLGVLAGLSGQSVDEDQMQPRPQQEADVQEVSSIADFDVGHFLRTIST